MSSPRRPSRRGLIACGGAAALLTGCGFAPVYGPGGAANALRGQVAMPTPADALEVQLIAQLENRLGAASAQAPYALAFDLQLRMAAQGINPDQETTRVNLIGELSWQLRDRAAGAEVTTGVEQSFTSYSTTANTAATLAAEEDAESRLMVILADLLVDGLVLAAPALGAR